MKDLPKQDSAGLSLGDPSTPLRSAQDDKLVNVSQVRKNLPRAAPGETSAYAVLAQL